MRFPFIRGGAVLAGIAALVSSGCAKEATTQAPPAVPSAAEAPVAGTPSQAYVEHGKPGTTQDPSAAPAASSAPAGITPDLVLGNAALTPTPDLDAEVARLEKAGGDKKALATAYVKRGTARLKDDRAAPRAKYPAALKDFRRALALDPTNGEAQKNAQTIEDIYKSLGRPVPKP